LHDTMVLAVALIQLLCHTYIAVNNNDWSMRTTGNLFLQQ
jgi:hypothetical protein